MLSTYYIIRIIMKYNIARHLEDAWIDLMAVLNNFKIESCWEESQIGNIIFLQMKYLHFILKSNKSKEIIPDDF